MAEDDAPRRSDEDEETPTIAVPSRGPLPPPPEVHYTRPAPSRGINNPSASSPGGKADPEGDGAAGHGAGLAAGMTFITSILAGLLAGNWLDSHYIHSATPWGTLGMTAVGMAVGFTNMSRLMSRGGRRKP